ncbi:MAG: EAL domain-containing protein [Rhizobiaceae bacterium]|nr:EAL domain-containing protein [Rhizobiaceae bacterium]
MTVKLHEQRSTLHSQFLKLMVGCLFVLSMLLLVAAVVLPSEGLVTAMMKSTIMIPVFLMSFACAAAFITYVTKPLRRLSREIDDFAADNLKRDFKMSGLNEMGELGASFSAMTERVQRNIEKIQKLAYVDRTTQLPNREYFRKELTRSINRTFRTGKSGALLFVDLDGFKQVNDTLGHDLGDKLLLQFSKRISKVLRAEDLVGFGMLDPHAIASDASIDGDDIEAPTKHRVLARLGGDEFTVLLSEIKAETDAATVARRIINAANEPFEIDGAQVTIGASIGIATFPRDGADYQSVLNNADLAMYQAKDDGKNVFRYFSEELNLHATNRLQIESELRTALKNGDEFVLHYQPKIDCSTGRPVSVEALLRWNHPEKGMLYPGDFIPIAEECGLIGHIGDWVLAEACAQLSIFDSQGMDLGMAINISPTQTIHPNFAVDVLNAVKTSGINPAKLELEITNSLLPENMDCAQSNFTKIASRGIQFAVDDFGGGLEGLFYLENLPVQIFKIDYKFVKALDNPDDKRAPAVVKSILGIAKSLNLKTVAEGVETEEQLDFLKKNGCDFVQGYFLARPQPVKELNEWLSVWKKENSVKEVKITKRKVA